MAAPGSLVLAAVSGGPDSLCLLHALVRLRRLLGIEVACFHFDHGLRADSASDLGFVRDEAERLGVHFDAGRAADGPPRGASVEAWARDARYTALRAAAARLGADVVATGHTMDDQAETVLMACLRGGGIDALAGISPVADGVVRPMLDVRRDETEAFCRALGLRPLRDPMNDDTAFLRVALRRDVLPAIEEAAGRGVTESVARTARLLGEDARFLDGLAAAAAPAIRADGATPPGDGEGGAVALRATALLALPRPLASRVVRGALADAGAPGEAAHVAAILDLAGGRPGRRATLSAGLLARRDREYVRLFHSPGGTGA
jgi:tRNA(Ile)-lysidine synthase